MVEQAILYDASKCTACRGCQVACKQWWGLKGEQTTNRGTYENPPDLSYNTWIKIRFNEIEKENGGIDWVFSRQSCMHCTDAACVNVCPSGALSHHPSGAVVYNPDICTECGYCTQFCPFHVPKKKETGAFIGQKIGKCILCIDRISNGHEPACVQTCPTGALTFGNRTDLIATGKKRVQELKAKYPDAYLYGENELGGLHSMYVLTHNPEEHGLPANPEMPVSVMAWKDILKPAGGVLVAVAAAGLGLNYLVARAALNKKAEDAGHEGHQ